MTKIKRDLDDLLKRYKELEFIINKSPIVVFLWKNEADWPVEFVSENITQFGYTKDEFLSGRIKYSDIIYQEDLERVAKEVATYSESDLTEFTQEYRIFSKSKDILWVDDRTFIRRNDKGVITHFQGIILDITEKKQIHEQLELSKQRLIDSEIKYRTLFEQAEDAICLLDPESGEFLEFNRKAYEQLGYTLQEFKQLKIADFEVIESAKEVQEHSKKILDLGFDKFETKHRTKSGEVRDVYVSSKRIEMQGKTYILVVYKDITEQRLSEKKLKDSEEKFRQISEQLLVSIGILQNNKVIYVNKKLCEMFGYSYEELINWTFEDFHKVIHPDFMEEEMKLINQIIQDPAQQEIHFRSKAIKKSGEAIWAENLFKKIMYNDCPALLGMFIDITEKVEFEYALKLTQFAIDHSVDPAFWMDDQFQIIYVNEALCKSLEYTREELLSMKGSDLNPTYPKEAWRPTWEKIKEKGSVVIETYHQKKNGVLLPVEVYISYLHYDNKEYNCAFAHDISDRKRSERKLKESEEKYREAFYRENFYKDLFTHDMRNILQAINTSFELYEHNLKSKMGVIQSDEFFEIIPFQINRATHLINNIKEFSELDTFEQSLTMINIYQVVQQNIYNIQSLSKNKRVSIKIEPKNQINYLILGNELLNEAIENILLNSIIHNDNEEIRISIRILKVLREQKPYIKVEFSDNGRGIEDSRKRIIFNRAYNQDKSTIGMGLGLSLVRMIIEKLDGFVWVEDRVLDDYEQGSKFIILLPEVD
ncbi:MAG: PAS domain S-box protein [Promethearchaeota archaeon]